MAATLTDVARDAGVSLATASRAFSDPERLAPSTLERVLRTAGTLGYTASIATTAERTIGIVVPDVANPVHALFLRGAFAQAWHGRHKTVLFNANEDPRWEREEVARAAKLDAVVLCSPRLESSDIFSMMGSTPFVVVNRIIEGVPSIVMDDEHGHRAAVEHLSALGHTHIAYAAGPENSWANAFRLDVITKACKAFGLKLTVLSNQRASIDGGRVAAAPLLASGATAVLAYNDLVAIGIDAGLSDLGKRCPADISIVGVDDTEMASVHQPGLTTVRFEVERSGSLAIEVLLQALAGETPTDVHRLHGQLIVRGSTAAPRTID